MNEESTLFSDWVDALTIADVANVLLLVAFVTFIIILVVRTFKNDRHSA